MIVKKIHWIILFIFFSYFASEAKVRNDKPLVWDVCRLEQNKADGVNSQLTREILKEADTFCKAQPVAVTEKNKLTFEPNKHYFCCIGPYWWPDSLKTGKYINKDGVVNPESNFYDNSRLAELANRCKILGEAFYITENSLYYKTFLRQLRVWFLDKDTYMFPTFEYAQVVPGQNDNKGRSTGMICAYCLNTVIESIRLVNSVKKIDRRTMRGVKKWFFAFASDSEERYGQELMNVDNNISLAYDVTMVNMFLFAGKEFQAKKIVDGFAERRINVQIMDDGRQPAELNRTKAFYYSIYNLNHIVDLCYLARYWYPGYYKEHKERIDKAFDFLGQYVDSPESFPYKQISSWDSCKKDYNNQIKRLNTLRRVVK